MTTVRTRARCQDAAALLEWLEPRIVLAGEPFPTLAMLEDVNNAVVRIETRYGVIDVELFNADAPVAAGAFTGLIDQGGYGATFFHRLTAGETLAGGLFRFTDEEGLSLREDTFGVDDQFLRPNVERTLALRVEPGSAESSGEWVFNLADNSATTDSLVIGRVIQGWEVVQEIAGLPVEDISMFLDPVISGPLTSVPVNSNTPPPPTVTEDLLVSLTDIQVIKEQGPTGFYSHMLYFPEGFSWQRVFEAVELMNPGEGPADFKVLVRYEWGARDKTLATGTLEADRRETIIVSPGRVLSQMVRSFTPYAFEIWSTSPIVAGIRHMDFGAGVGELFFNPASAPNRELMRSWSFSQAALGSGDSEVFILWQNTTGTDATVTLTLFFQNADPIVETFTLDAHRRGGVRIADLDLPPGEDFAGALVTADTEIVASLTRFDQRSGGNGGHGGHGGDGGDDDEDDGSIAALGTPGGGATEGVAPWTQRGRDDPLAILNAGNQAAIVTFFITEEEDEDEGEDGGDPTIVQRQFIVPAGRVLILTEDEILGEDEDEGEDDDDEGEGNGGGIMAMLGMFGMGNSGHGGDGDGGHGNGGHGNGRAFSIRYESDQPVTVSFLTSAFRGTGTAFGYFAAEETHFADARVFTHPRGAPFGKQALAVFNPQATDVTLHFVFRFSDHDPVVTQTITLGAGESLVKRVNKFAPLLARHLNGLGGLAHSAYSVSVIADAPVVAHTIQRKGDGRTELGMTLTPWTLISAIP